MNSRGPSAVRRQPSLVLRLVRAAAVWTVPALIVASILLTWLYRSTIYRSFDDPLESAVTAIVASVEVSDRGQIGLLREPLDPRYQRALSGRYWMIGQMQRAGSVTPLIASRSLYGETINIAPADRIRLDEASGEIIRFSSQGPNETEPLRVVARQVTLPNMTQPVVVMAAADRRPATRSILNFALTAVIVLIVLAGGLLAAIYAQVRLGLQPLFALRNRVADVREGRADQVPGEFPAEIEPLARELNSLIAHNRNVVERAQTHVGNLAHGLKTPLSVLQNEAGMGEQVSADVVARQTESMRNQVEHHLRRARAAARGQAIGVTSDVDEVISSLARTLPRIYRDKDFTIEVDGEAGLRFRGDKRDLEDMVGNLMDNGAKWSTALIEVRREVDGEWLFISVEDDGPGIPEGEMTEALKRGARLDEQTPGSGLGLSIVTDLAEAYGGLLSLTRSDLGGLKAALKLPIAAS